MITSDEAEERAQALVKQFVKDAECRDMRDVANVLAKLVVVAGLSMSQAIGRKEALLRMSAATTAVHNKDPIMAPQMQFDTRGLH